MTRKRAKALRAQLARTFDATMQQASREREGIRAHDRDAESMLVLGERSTRQKIKIF